MRTKSRAISLIFSVLQIAQSASASVGNLFASIIIKSNPKITLPATKSSLSQKRPITLEFMKDINEDPAVTDKPTENTASTSNPSGPNKRIRFSLDNQPSEISPPGIQFIPINKRNLK